MPTLLDSIPSNPLTDYLRQHTVGSGGNTEEHRSYFILKRLDTGASYRFQFSPSLNMTVRNEIAMHQGVRSDAPYPIPQRGGSRQFYLWGYFYKVDKTYDINVVAQNLMALAIQKDGKLPLLLLYRPGKATTKVYCQSISIRYPDNMAVAVAPDEPRYIDVSMDFIKYLPLPKPSVSGAAPANTAFYTAEQSSTDNKTGSSSKKSTPKSAEDVLNGILSGAAQGEENEMPLDGLGGI